MLHLQSSEVLSPSLVSSPGVHHVLRIQCSYAHHDYLSLNAKYWVDRQVFVPLEEDSISSLTINNINVMN